MLERLREIVCEGGPIKTPLVAMAGWFTWDIAKGILEAGVLVGTAVIVAIHVLNALLRQWCPSRRKRSEEPCKFCKLSNSIFCPIRTKDTE